MKKNGFTLLELMITLSLCALIMGLSVTYISIDQNTQVFAELNTLQAVCRLLQHQAYATHTSRRLVFDVKNSSYTYDGHTHYLARPLVFDVDVSIKGPPSNPQHVLVKPITFKNRCITFSPHGIMESGTIYMKNTQTKVVYALTAPVAHYSVLRKYVYKDSWQVLC